ncbi:MAG: amino acid permease [Francisellaceae bacterium]
MSEMTMNSVSGMKKLGGALIVAGTSIGAGMFGIPYAIAALGFKMAVVLLFINWIIMFATAMLITEVNTRQPLGSDLNTLAKSTLGKPGQIVNWIAYLLLLYALTTAYISMGGGLIDQYVFGISSKAPTWYGALIFTLVLGAVVYIGTSAVDQLNKLFFTLKALCFIGLVFVVVPHVEMRLLNTSSMGIAYAWYAFPILITSFGFHIVIPTIRNYFRNDRVLKKVVAVGATIPMAVYLVWIFVTLGVIPIEGQYGFIALIAQGHDLGYAYERLLQIHSISGFIIAFANIAVTTSFLGVTLALFNFNQDAYGLTRTSHSRRLVNFMITYVPPFIFAVFFVNGFLAALGYASIFVCILLIILPALMAWSLRRRENRNDLFSKLYLIVLILCGVSIIVIQFLSSFGLLKVLG